MLNAKMLSPARRKSVILLPTMLMPMDASSPPRTISAMIKLTAQRTNATQTLLPEWMVAYSPRIMITAKITTYVPTTNAPSLKIVCSLLIPFLAMTLMNAQELRKIQTPAETHPVNQEEPHVQRSKQSSGLDNTSRSEEHTSEL